MPKWLDNAIFYEIYPQSFRDSNADGIGDIPGIIEKLDYVRELGCNAIWLNPCFQSPFRDAGYDISDYYQVAPRYGTNEDLKRLCQEVHRRGMHILLDLVPGHTSVDHPWFRQSQKDEKNDYTDRYVWTDGVWESPEGMDCIRGISERDGACVVNFFSHQPALNYGFYKCEKSWQQPMDARGPQATLKAMMDVMRFWLQMGCDGFRVDMAGSLVKNDPEQKGTIALWQKVRTFLDKEFPQAALVSEWGEPDKSLAAGFHMDFLLHFGPSHYNDLFRIAEPFFSSSGFGDASKFVETYRENYAKTEGKGLICIPSGNHDMDRLSLRLMDDEGKMAFAFLLSMPGAPFIYYGDEVGQRQDLWWTSVEGGYGRTAARAPMKWDDSLNFGFSAAPKDRLYIPMSERGHTVQKQMADKNSLYHEVKKLIAIRQAHEALQSNGKIEFVCVRERAYPLAYLRSAQSERILVILNPASEAVTFPGTYIPKQTVYLLGEDAGFEGEQVTVPPCSAGFYTLA